MKKTLEELLAFFMNDEGEIAPASLTQENLKALNEYAFNNNFEAVFTMYMLYGAASEGETSIIEPDDRKREIWLEKLIRMAENGKEIKRSTNRSNDVVNDFFDGIFENPRKNIYRLAMMFYQESENYSFANKYAESAISFDKNDAYAHYILGCNLFYGEGVDEDDNAALKHLTKYIELCKKEQAKSNGNVWVEPFAYSILGMIYEGRDMDSKALECFKEGADLGSTFCMYYAGRHFTYIEDLENARKYLMRAVKNDYVDALIDVATRMQYGIAGFQESVKRAEKYYLKAIELGTDDAAAYVGLCDIYIDSEKYDEAIKYGEYALNNCEFYDENDLSVYGSIALAYYYLEDYDKALAYAQKAVEYGDEDAVEFCKQIRKVKRFGFFDKILKSPLLDAIPGVSIVSKGYKIGASLGESFEQRNAKGVAKDLSNAYKYIMED